MNAYEFGLKYLYFGSEELGVLNDANNTLMNYIREVGLKNVSNSLKKVARFNRLVYRCYNDGDYYGAVVNDNWKIIFAHINNILDSYNSLAEVNSWKVISEWELKALRDKIMWIIAK